MAESTLTRRRAPGRRRGPKLVSASPMSALERAEADPLAKLLAAAEARATGPLREWLRALLAGDRSESGAAKT